MKKCLFVDCLIRNEESRTKGLADAFFENLKDYEIEHLVLEEECLKPLTGDFFYERQELLDKKDLTHNRFRYAWQFKEADLIVIAAPFWDLSFPSLLKIYIENISVDSITFGSTEKGLQGLCKADNLVYLTTRGGIYGDNNPLDCATPYMKALGPFFGFDKVSCIAADGMDVWGYDAKGSLEDAKQKAISLAKTL